MNEIKKATPKPTFLWYFSSFLAVFNIFFNYELKVEQKLHNFVFLVIFCFFWHPYCSQGFNLIGLNKIIMKSPSVTKTPKECVLSVIFFLDPNFRLIYTLYFLHFLVFFNTLLPFQHWFPIFSKNSSFLTRIGSILTLLHLFVFFSTYCHYLYFLALFKLLRTFLHFSHLYFFLQFLLFFHF